MFDKLIRSGTLGKIPDFIQCQTLIAEGHIAFHSVREEEDVLGCRADSAAQLLKLPFPDIAAVHQNSAVRDIVKPGHQLNERALAAACRSHDRHSLAGKNMEGNVFEDLLGIIPEGNIPELNLALHLRVVDSELRIRNVGLEIGQFHHLGSRRGKALEIIDQVAQFTHRVGHSPGKAGKNGQLAGRQLPVDNEQTTHKHIHQHHAVGQQFNHREEGQPCLVDLQMALPERFILFPETVFFIFFACKRLDDTVSGDVFLCRRIHFREFFAHGNKPRTNVTGKQFGDHQEDGRDDDQHKRHLPADRHQINCCKQKCAGTVDNSVVNKTQKMAAPVKVSRHACHQVTGTMAVEETHIVVLHFFEQACPKVEDYVL